MSQSSNDDEPSPLFSPLLEAAVRLASQGHYHQFRKRSTSVPRTDRVIEQPLPAGHVPYITHLVGSMCILAKLGARDEVLAAALLHDYLEDVPDPDGLATLRASVGDEVLDLVLAVTEDKSPTLDESESWELRKAEQIRRIAAMPAEAVMVKIADLLHNVQSLLADLATTDQQAVVWDRLNAGPERQLWYFESALGAARKRLPDHRLIEDFATALGQLRSRITG